VKGQTLKMKNLDMPDLRYTNRNMKSGTSV